ncbi:aspartate aminotransferase family protein [Saccharibacillus sp. CPCC 101409]|uniref:aspartate aminotransferase family protein n=1 Tax=Saccharibacillus sp. CPCC 101409 TaxID=3058041 RepID=UPI002670D0A1|nr:aspartate aminotransferase family protein [Saccharibacillus sp. CPCC 101409]MDO3412058.1 aspartate aminotransferase family protein [Saccharibacillus sp. CPCC 101409]
MSSLFQTYARYPLAFVKGQGSWLWDDKGNKYLDFMSGLAVTNLGHAPKKVSDKLKEQIDTLWHTSNLFIVPKQEEAAQKLAEVAQADAVFFCNSGAEANEAAIKLARRYFQKVKGEERYEIVTLGKSFHGRTLATLTATGQDKVKEGFLPLPAGFVTVPPNDIRAIEDAVNERTAAVMIEMVQAEGGVYPLDETYAKQIEQLCRDKGILLIVDEVQTGMGRTGAWFAHHRYGLKPDIFTVAKGVASGFPAGAMLGREYLKEAFIAGSHATTFGGTPLASSAIIATIETMQEDDLPQHAAKIGELLAGELRKELGDHPFVQEVRGLGLLIGIECTGPVGDLVLEGQKRGLLFVTAGPNVIRLLPNLYVSEEEVHQAVNLLTSIIQEKVPTHSV